MVAEEIMIVLSGGGPWGFRLQGGLEQQKPLQVAKVSEQPSVNRREPRRSWLTGVLRGTTRRHGVNLEQVTHVMVTRENKLSVVEGNN